MAPNALLLAVIVGVLAFVGVFGIIALMSGSVSVVETRLRGLRREHEPGQSWRARLHSAGDVVRQIGEVLPRSRRSSGAWSGS